MTALKKQYEDLRSIAHKALKYCACLILSTAAGFALAQENAIQSISANQHGSNVIVKVVLKNPVAKPPIGFSITNPARIALDFSGTVNSTGKTTQEIGLGNVRKVT